MSESQFTIDFESHARDLVFATMEETRAYYLEQVRGEMRQRAIRHPLSPLTPDDAREYFESLSPPDPEELSRNFLALVFRGPEWEVCGTYRSQTPGSHRNKLNQYRLRSGMEEAA